MGGQALSRAKVGAERIELRFRLEKSEWNRKDCGKAQHVNAGYTWTASTGRAVT